MTVEELRARLTEDPSSVFVLDVREPHERAYCCLAGSVHIPMREVAQRWPELPRDRPVVVYCHTGGRSALVCGFLRSKGIPAVNLLGGIDDWSARIDPSLPRY